MIKHDPPMLGDSEEVDAHHAHAHAHAHAHMPVQGPELPGGIDDKQHEGLPADMPMQLHPNWFTDKNGAPAPTPLHAAVLPHHHVQPMMHPGHHVGMEHHMLPMDLNKRPRMDE